MSHRETILNLIKDNTVSATLRRRSGSRDEIRALQSILYDLGFEDELNWQKYGADGDYGGGTTRAVKAFAERNGLPGDGGTLTPAIAAKLIGRYDILDDLRHIHNAVAQGKVEQLYFRGSPHSTAVVALQTLLNELGFGEELNWAKYGADGNYGGGTTKALKAFARQESIRSDGRRLTAELARRIIDRFKGFFGPNWAKDTAPAEETTTGVTVREAVENGRARIYVSLAGREVRFTKFKRGVYVFGQRKPLDLIYTNRPSLSGLGLTDSAINVMVAVSENEGNLDAVNTWDNSFMTFGMFQWTAGAENDRGELPALLQKIKMGDEAVFQNYYGQHGLDVIDTDEITGFFTLAGQKLAASFQKEQLRAYEWAFYFWLSGQDPVVQTIEIQHALSRINTFYRSNSYRVRGNFIADLVTSEYGVGLLLDNHVNRPGYIKPCLEKAMDQTGLANPQNWDTADEGKLIDAYLKIRETHGRNPMTDAAKRAAVTRKYLENGIISDERGSFQHNI
jgi:peptidoglycan hydrolase-like protein with peptidoglycan-binding domain